MEVTKKHRYISAAILVFLVVLLLRVFVVEGFVVRGDSMNPNVNSGDYVFVNKLAYLRRAPERGDIVIANPREESIKVLKRIIGLPGERFEIVGGKVTIRDRRLDPKNPIEEAYLSTGSTPAVGIIDIKLDPEEYFALGDGRSVSIDSRQLGPIDRWDIKGRVFGVFNFKTFKYKSL